jgi:hypothetical protein
MYALNIITLLIHGRMEPARSGRKRVCTLPLVMRNLQALDRVVRTIGELCARRLDRISRLDVRQQGDRGFGLHSARVGKYIDVSVLLLPKSVVATRVRRWCTGEATCCATITIREAVELVTVSFSRVGGFSHCSHPYLAGPRFS